MFLNERRASDDAAKFRSARNQLEACGAFADDAHTLLVTKKRVFFILGLRGRRTATVFKMLKLARKDVELYAKCFVDAGQRAPVVAKPAPAPREPVQKAPPKGKYSPEWNRIFEAAKREGNPFPEKLADSALRSKERTMEIDAKKHKLIQVDKKPPKENETGIVTAICKARTMAGTKCTFKAVCGEFCKKHAPKWTPLKERPSGSCKGYICVDAGEVERVFGKQNGVPDEKIEKEWNVEIDGTKLSMYYRHGDPSLHIGSVTLESIAKVRKVLGV